jgi:hypothetical protein
MLVQFYLSNDALFGLLRYRILDAYRPVSGPIPVFGFMDGMEDVVVSVVHPPQTVDFTLNVAGPTPGSVTPTPGIATMQAATITLAIDFKLYTVTEPALPTDANPATGAYPRPNRIGLSLSGAQAKLFMTVSPTGDPVLNVQLFKPPTAVDPNDPSWKSIASAQNSIPLPIRSALSGLIGPAVRILNAGIAPTSDGNAFVIRMEADDPQLPSPGERVAAWTAFFAGQQPSRLGTRAWAAEVPTAYLVQTATGQFDKQMGSFDIEKFFTNYDSSWGNWTWDQPQLTLHKRGVFENSCAGLDIRAEVTVTITLSVPTENTVRASFHLDVSPDDWDMFKCGLAFLVNPLAPIITAYDLSSKFGLPWWADLGIIAVGRDLVPPLLIALVLTNYEFLIGIVLKEVQDTLAKSGTTLVRTSDTDAYVDTSLSLGGLGSAAWLTLNETAGFQDHLLLRGNYNPPDFDRHLHVVGALTDGFRFWQKGKCVAPSYSAYSTTARLHFSLADDFGNNVLVPVISMKCGVDPVSRDTRCWRVVDDSQGVYSRDQTLIHWTGAGVPGDFEIVVTDPPADFVPYPLHLQLYTNYGVRQFNIPAPPPLPKLPSTQQEVIAEAAHRISECYAISSLLSLIKALQVFWLPYPTPDESQHWQIQVNGLKQQDWIRAWDAERGTLLAEASAWGRDYAELSLVTGSRPVRVLQVTLNDQPMLSMDRYRELSGAVEGKPETALNPVIVKQTRLLPLREFALPGRATNLDLQVSASGIVMLAWDRETVWQISTRPRGLHDFTLTRLDAPPQRFSALPSRTMSLSHGVHEERSVSRLFSAAGVEIGRFFVRPWWDGGSAAGDYFARLNDERNAVVLYGRCAALVAYPQVGDNDTGARTSAPA